MVGWIFLIVRFVFNAIYIHFPLSFCGGPPRRSWLCSLCNHPLEGYTQQLDPLTLFFRLNKPISLSLYSGVTCCNLLLSSVLLHWACSSLLMFPVIGRPKPDTAFQVQSLEYHGEGITNSPSMLSTLSNAAPYTVSLFLCKGTSLAHIQLVHHDPQVPERLLSNLPVPNLYCCIGFFMSN